MFSGNVCFFFSLHFKGVFLLGIEFQFGHYFLLFLMVPLQNPLAPIFSVEMSAVTHTVVAL